MSRRRKCLVAGLAAMLVALASASAALAGGANNVAIAQATAGDQTSVQSQLQIAPYGGDDADSSNVALASSHDCTGCSTTAVAVQVIFLIHDPNTVAPSNAAVATNIRCASCTAYAYAWQYVLSTNGPVHLSPAGEQEVETLRSEIAAAASSGLPPDELTAQLDGLTAQLKSVIDQDLVQAGQPANGHAQVHVEDGQSPPQGQG